MAYSFGRPMARDDNHQVVQGGTTMEVQILTCTVSCMQAMNFNEVPKAVKFQTRTGATDVEFIMGTSTVAQSAAGGYYTMRAGQELAVDCASSGPYYFRNSAASQESLVIGVALL